jgi:hypothetical protein
MNVKNTKNIHRVPIQLVDCQTIENNSKINKIGKYFCGTKASEGCKKKMKVPIKIKREGGELSKENEKNMSKFEEIIIQETKEEILEERCKIFKYVRTLDNLNKDTEDRIIPIQIKLNNIQNEKGNDINRERVIDKERSREENVKTKNQKVIKKESPIINADAVNY